jgi:hypothetical protein
MAKSSKKLTKIKVPKRVVGVKIPKTVRKGPVLDFVNSSAGRMLIAEALTAAVGIFAYKQAGSSDPQAGGGYDTQDALKRNTARLSHAFAEGVQAFRRALANPEPDASGVLETAGRDVGSESAAPAKKKARSIQNEPSMPGGV